MTQNYWDRDRRIFDTALNFCSLNIKGVREKDKVCVCLCVCVCVCFEELMPSEKSGQQGIWHEAKPSVVAHGDRASSNKQPS